MLTRQEIAIGQGLVTSLLIHVSGGHFEMRYAVFASLAFLAMYRDITVILLASLITTVDHVLGCFFWPKSLYGFVTVAPWAWMHHVSMVALENVFLGLAIRKSQGDMLSTAKRAGDDRREPRRARARGLRAPAHGAAALAAVRDHARARGREQPRRGGAAHAAHHGREPGLGRGRAVGGRGRRALPALRGPLARRRLPGRRLPAAPARHAARARRRPAGSRVAPPPAAVDPRHGRGAEPAARGVSGRGQPARRLRDPAAQRART